MRHSMPHTQTRRRVISRFIGQVRPACVSSLLRAPAAMPPPGREALAVEEGRAHAHSGAEAQHHAHGHSHSHGSVRLRRPGDSEPAADYDAAHDRVHSGGYVNSGMRAAMLGFPGKRTALLSAVATRLPCAPATRVSRRPRCALCDAQTAW
jgi:hypothetical protein